MSLSIPGVVCFDYGEVLSHSPSQHDKDALVAVAGIRREELSRFWDAYWERRPPLDQGVVSVDEYWRGLGEELGRDWNLAARQRLWVADFRSWISIDPGMVPLLEELRDGGTRLALLSNAGFDFGDPFRRAPTATLFERIFVSAELGMLKPDPAIYERVCDELGVGISEFVFIDNKAENVEPVIALGGRGHHYTAHDSLRDFLERLAAGDPDSAEEH